MQTIVIFSALRKELKPLLQDIQKKTEVAKVNEIVFYSGYLQGIKSRIIFGSFGIGKVLAALSTQFLIDKFKPRHLYLIGACGGATTGINPGDIVFADETIQADFDVSCFGGVKGEFQLDAEEIKYKEFRTDREIINWLNTGAKLSLKPILQRQPTVRVGRIASQDRFETKIKSYRDLEKEFHYLGIDMESAAAKIVCNLNGVPFNVIKSALDTAGKIDDFYHKYFSVVCENSYTALKTYLQSQKPITLS